MIFCGSEAQTIWYVRTLHAQHSCSKTQRKKATSWRLSRKVLLPGDWNLAVQYVNRPRAGPAQADMASWPAKHLQCCLPWVTRLLFLDEGSRPFGRSWTWYYINGLGCIITLLFSLQVVTRRPKSKGPYNFDCSHLRSVVTALKPVRAEQLRRPKRKQNWTVPRYGSVLPRPICLSLRPWSYSLYTVELPRNLTCPELG